MAKIYIYGEIYSGSYQAQEVREQLISIPKDEEIEIYINSPGGSVNAGFAIHDILATAPNPITTIGEGLVGSIATVIFLAGNTRKLTKNAQFFVHNPIVYPSDSLTADELEEWATRMREVEAMILDFYAGKLGLGARNKKELYKLMQKETTLSAEAAIEFGFATELMPELMAMAKLDKGGLDMGLMEKLGLRKSEEKEKGEKDILDLKLATEEGVILNVQTKEKHPAVGMDVLIENDKAGDGEYFVPGMAKNIVVKNGKIEDIHVREIELEKEVNDADALKAADTIEAKLNTPEWQASVTAQVEAKFKPVSEQMISTTQTVAALTNKFNEQGEIIKAQQGFLEVQSKVIEDVKKEANEKLNELKEEFNAYKVEVEEVLAKVVSTYSPPALNTFKEKDAEVDYKAPRTSFEKKRAEIIARNTK